MRRSLRIDRSLRACVLAAASLVATAAHAQDSHERTDVHGFGSWAYGNTDGNLYLAGDDEGRYDEASFAINVVSNVSDRLVVVGQVEWRDETEGTDVELDYAFAEWKLSDKLKLRAGKVKQPFGISTEVFDVGTLRPFVELPQAIYGPVGLVGESYKGIGITGFVDLNGGWGLSYDLYGGGQELSEYVPPEAVLLGEPFDEATETEKTRNLVGGRMVLETPVAGLRFGGSVYTGDEIGSTRRTGLGLQGEYLARPWSVRSEYARETVADDLEANGFYAEVAYRVGSHWQAAAQYGHLSSELAGVSAPTAPSLLRHEEVAAGLNYWWSPNFVLKLSFHHVDGNRFAGPDPAELEGAVAAGTLQKKTNLVLLGAQFSF